ncbi:MAG TPA: hypothetical protein VL688_02120 [Verrucomicrobiae bacterium]|nr:hypothetical protein [Verrucomicrobiae bacterium]
MFEVFKVLFSGLIISFASWLAGRRPVLAGFIIALPMMSILSIFFSYYQYRDMNKINEFATSILIAVPLSLTFFLPFVLNRWLKMSFPMTMACALGLVVAGYALHALVFRRAA